MMSLAREFPPRRQRTLEQRYLTVKFNIEKQRHGSRTTIGQALRGVTMKKVGEANLEMMPTWKEMFSHMLFSFKLCICQDPRIARACTAQNTQICALLACLAQPTYPIPARCGTDTAGLGAFEPSPEDGARTKRFDREIPVPRFHTEAETKNS